MKEAHDPLRGEALAFQSVGNVEGHDILRGRVDVVVCDGFVGNAVLKSCEEIAHRFIDLLKRDMDPPVLQSESMQRPTAHLDYSTYGGAPLLGVEGVTIICHGRSPARAIRNAIGVAARAAVTHLSQHIGADLVGGVRA